MKALPQHIHDTVNNSLATIKRKSPEKKTLIIGTSLCIFILLLICLIDKEITSINASIEGIEHTVYSPVDGLVVELPFAEGTLVEKGDALLRFDPAHIRKQNTIIREYLLFFQQNKHNTGTLKQKFRPLFANIFSELAGQRKLFMEKEKEAIELYKKASLLHSKLQIQMRDPNNHDAQGLPKKEFIKKEEQASLDIVEIGKNLERVSLERAGVDKQIRDVTSDLNQPYGMLYRYLEEQQNEVQALVRHEYLYAEDSAHMGKLFVSTGEYVKKDAPLYEVLPEDSGQWWVNATFSIDDAENLKEKDICTIETEDGFEFEARIISITPKKDETEVRLFAQNAPEDLSPSNFVKVIKK